MTERIIIAGSGGQGIMLIGKVLAQAAMEDNLEVTWLPAYGAEVRGGTAHCMIVISDKPIGSPRIDKADIIIALNQLSFIKFFPRLKKGGLLIVNSSLVNVQAGLRIVKYPFTDIALKIGNIKVANMVALGCLLGKREVVSVKNVLNIIKEMAPKDKPQLIAINQEALNKGMEL